MANRSSNKADCCVSKFMIELGVFMFPAAKSVIGNSRIRTWETNSLFRRKWNDSYKYSTCLNLQEIYYKQVNLSFFWHKNNYIGAMKMNNSYSLNKIVWHRSFTDITSTFVYPRCFSSSLFKVLFIMYQHPENIQDNTLFSNNRITAGAA